MNPVAGSSNHGGKHEIQYVNQVTTGIFVDVDLFQND